MKLIVAPEVKKLGIEAVLAVFSGTTISNKSQPLEKLKKEAVETILATDYASDPILQAYRELHARAGLEEGLPPAEHLINLIKRNGRLPNINTVVDCYNLVSASTRLSIGAHDLDHITGDVAFRLTTGAELYVPLGESAPVAVRPGEYACMDAQKIICRMDLKQCQQTRITKETTRFLVYVQGNRNTAYPYLQQGLAQVCKLIQEVGGGTYQQIEEDHPTS